MSGNVPSGLSKTKSGIAARLRTHTARPAASGDWPVGYEECQFVGEARISCHGSRQHLPISDLDDCHQQVAAAPREPPDLAWLDIANRCWRRHQCAEPGRAALLLG